MADHDVFINCPFDDEFEPLFEAIVFTVHASLYRVRCALEEHDSSDIRYDRLCNLIRESPRSIHDLSRTQSSDDGLPRFNMPLELGLFLGAKRFGPPSLRSKSALILIERKHSLPTYVSDLGGNDPKAHNKDVRTVISCVRDYLHCSPDGVPLPGVNKYDSGLAEFHRKLPEFLRDLQLDQPDARPFKSFRRFYYILAEFLMNEPVV